MGLPLGLPLPHQADQPMPTKWTPTCPAVGRISMVVSGSCCRGRRADLLEVCRIGCSGHGVSPAGTPLGYFCSMAC
jgi:hypothetical protein